jgi:hypothetical protein
MEYKDPCELEPSTSPIPVKAKAPVLRALTSLKIWFHTFCFFLYHTAGHVSRETFKKGGRSLPKNDKK